MDRRAEWAEAERSPEVAELRPERAAALNFPAAGDPERVGRQWGERQVSLEGQERVAPAVREGQLTSGLGAKR
jgi:hypothetical protein